MRKPQNEHNLRSQIFVLEQEFKKAILERKPAQTLYKLKAKINRLNKQLEKIVHFNWLAR